LGFSTSLVPIQGELADKQVDTMVIWMSGIWVNGIWMTSFGRLACVTKRSDDQFANGFFVDSSC
jgi:hypothetical protein